MQGVQALATALGGIAAGIGGLGIGGGLLLAGLMWGRDLQELAAQIIDFWPESGKLFSPEWIANFGDNPIDILGDNSTETGNQEVEELGPIANVGSLEGRSYYDVYSIACSGRAAAWTHNKNNIINNWLLRQPPTNNLISPLVGDYSQGLTENQKTIIRAEWYKYNPQPPPILTVDELGHQTSLRLTCARRNTTRLLGINWIPFLGEDDPRRVETYKSDKLLDWCAWADPEAWHGDYGDEEHNVLKVASPTPYNYVRRKNDAKIIISEYSFWAATP